MASKTSLVEGVLHDKKYRYWFENNDEGTCDFVVLPEGEGEKRQKVSSDLLRRHERTVPDKETSLEVWGLLWDALFGNGAS